MVLTLSRIAAIPVLTALFFVPGDWVPYIACAVYTAAAVTDYLDGYFARAWKQQSKLGRIFDPIADKLLVAATILLLVAFDRVTGVLVLAALVILCREVLVSGLREFLAELRIGLPVSGLAKWKTGIQMTALGFLIVGDAQPTAFLPVTWIGVTGLWIAAVLTLVTGWDYLMAGLRHVGEDHPESPKSGKSGLASPAPRRAG
jgi:cardiolipin synthase